MAFPAKERRFRRSDVQKRSLSSPLVAVPTEWWPELAWKCSSKDAHSDSCVNGNGEEKEERKKGKKRGRRRR